MPPIRYALLLALILLGVRPRWEPPKPPPGAQELFPNAGKVPPAVAPPAKPGMVYVPGYYRKDGTYVKPYWRSK